MMNIVRLNLRLHCTNISVFLYTHTHTHTHIHTHTSTYDIYTHELHTLGLFNDCKFNHDLLFNVLSPI